MSSLQSALFGAFRKQGTTLQKPLSHQERQNLFFYFFRLNEQDQKSLELFSKKWEQIPRAHFDEKGLALIIFQIAQLIKHPNINDKQRGKILSHIRSHIDLWAEPVFEKIEHENNFSTQNLCKSAWALAVLDYLYKRNSFLETYQTLRKHINISQLSDQRDIKQVHDADMAFFKKTNVPNPQKSPTRSSLELDVKEVIKNTGIEIPEIPGFLIPQYPQAIDFPSCPPNGDVWNEVDGNFHFYDAKPSTPSHQLAYNTRTLLRSGLLQEAKPKALILRIDFATALYLQNTSSPKLKQKIYAMYGQTIDSGPGVYRSILTRDKHIITRQLVTPRR